MALTIRHTHAQGTVAPIHEEVDLGAEAALAASGGGIWGASAARMREYDLAVPLHGCCRFQIQLCGRGDGGSVPMAL